MATQEEIDQLRELEASQAPVSDETTQEDIKNQANTGEVRLEDFASSASEFAKTKQEVEDTLEVAIKEELTEEETVLVNNTINQIDEAIDDQQLLDILNQDPLSQEDVLNNVEQSSELLASRGQGQDIDVEVGDSNLEDGSILGSEEQGTRVNVNVGNGNREAQNESQEEDEGTDTTTNTSSDDISSEVLENNAPIIDPIGTQTVSEDGTKTIIFNATDIDNDTLTSTVTAENGTVVIDENGYIVYTPDTNYSGTTTITLTVNDGNGGIATQTFSMDVIEGADAPTLTVESTKTLDEDGSTSITYNASDVEGAVTTTASAENGTVLVNDDGTITYTPYENYHGLDTVTVTTTDSDGLTAVETSSITVNSINDAPTIDHISSQTLAEDGTKIISFNTEDVEGDNLTSSVTSTKWYSYNK